MAQAACTGPQTAGDDTVVCDPLFSGPIDTLAGNDTVTVNGGFTGLIATGADNDDITINGGLNLGVDAGIGNDALNVNGGVTVAVDLGAGRDTATITDGAVGALYTGDGQDVVMINGGAVAGLTTGDGRDQLTVTGGAHGALDMGAGADQITHDGGTVVAYDGGDGADTVDLLAGDVTLSVNGGDGGDQITLSGADIGLDIDGGTGADVINLVSGTVGNNVLGAEGGDQITLSGATITGNIDGGFGSDAITLSSGSVVSHVFGGNGADQIVLSGAAVTGDIAGGDGADVFSWSAGSAGGYQGGAGGDTTVVSGTAVIGASVLDGDGGAGSFSNGQIDQLTFAGWAGTIDSTQIVNQEQVLLTNNADLTLIDAVIPGTGLANENLTDGLTFQVDTGSFGRFQDDFTINGNVNNFGALDLSAANTATGTVLQITGNYAAASDLFIDANLSADGGASNDVDGIAGNGATEDSNEIDQTIVVGDVTGVTDVVVRNTGGAFVSTDLNMNGVVDANEGLLFAQSAGTAASDSFVLKNGPLFRGAYMFDIYSFDPGNSQSGGWDYVLASTFSPATLAYETLPSALLALSDTQSLDQRIGNRQWLVGGTAESRNTGVWFLLDGSRLDVTPGTSTTLTNYEMTTWRIQAGLDVELLEGAFGRLIGGLTVSGSDGDLRARSVAGAVNTDVTGRGVGLTLTWLAESGFYADAQIAYHDFDVDLTSASLGVLASGVEGSARTASLEMGQRVGVRQDMSLIPQAQLIWSDVDFDSFVGSNGEGVSASETDSLQLRLGLAVQRDWQLESGNQAALYGIINTVHQFRDQTGVTVDGTDLITSNAVWTGEIGIGGSYEWNQGRSSFYGEVIASETFGTGDASGLAGTIGARIRF